MTCHANFRDLTLLFEEIEDSVICREPLAKISNHDKWYIYCSLSKTERRIFLCCNKKSPEFSIPVSV